MRLAIAPSSNEDQHANSTRTRMSIRQMSYDEARRTAAHRDGAGLGQVNSGGQGSLSNKREGRDRQGTPRVGCQSYADLARHLLRGPELADLGQSTYLVQGGCDH